MGQFSTVDSLSESAVVVRLPPSNREVVGRLRFDPDVDISLQLLDHGGIEQIFGNATAHYPVILGQLVNGPPFTLVDGIVASRNFGAGGFADVKIVGNQLLVGMHLPDPTSKPFDEVRVTLTDLNEWFAVSPIQLKLEDLNPPEVGRKATITCKHLPRIGFSPVGTGPSLFSEQVISPTIDRPHRGVVSNQFELCLRPRAPFGLEECVVELFRLQAFMSILCGQQVFYRHASLYLHDLQGTPRQANAVRYMPRLARPNKEPKKRRADQILLSLPTIRDSLPPLWKSWTERYELYRSAVELFTSTELFGGQLLNFQLLAIMQALETLHRNRFGGTYATEGDYKLIADVLKNAMPPTTPGDLRNALKAKLKYGNEYSLRKRLRDLADGLPGSATGAIGTLIHPSLRDFLNKSVETRNYLTHFTSELEPLAFRDTDLFWATRLLRWFFVAVLLHDMGLPEEHLVDALTRAEDLTHARQSLTRTGPPPGFGVKIETTEMEKPAFPNDPSLQETTRPPDVPDNATSATPTANGDPSATPDSRPAPSDGPPQTSDES